MSDEDRENAERIFLGSSVDDFGLDPYAMRVLMHMRRRQGNNVECYPAIDSIAETCCMDRKTVQRAIRTLLERNVITRRSVAGTASKYSIQPFPLWRSHGPAASPANTGTRPKFHPGAENGPTQIPPRGAAQIPPREGYTIRISNKEIHPPAKAVGESVNGSGPSKAAAQKAEAAERIYQLYPRKVDRKRSIQKITTALKTTPEADILAGVDRWKRYWQATGTEAQYIPHAATFFGNERFNDQPPALNGRNGSHQKPSRFRN